MAKPATREQFKSYILRSLGSPVIQINVDDEQVEDRIDDALRYFSEYHFDGTEKVLYRHVITASDLTNEYITLPETFMGAQGIMPPSSLYSSHNMFNIRYQMALNDVFALTGGEMLSYVMVMRHIETINEVFVGQKPIRYNRTTNILNIDMDWTAMRAGEYLIVLGTKIVDPNVYTRIWSDIFLKHYATALVKMQWGSNLSKFSGVQLPGGIQFNGDKIYDEAVADVRRLEERINIDWAEPVEDQIG